MTTATPRRKAFSSTDSNLTNSFPLSSVIFTVNHAAKKKNPVGYPLEPAGFFCHFFTFGKRTLEIRVSNVLSSGFILQEIKRLFPRFLVKKVHKFADPKAFHFRKINGDKGTAIHRGQRRFIERTLQRNPVLSQSKDFLTTERIDLSWVFPIRGFAQKHIRIWQSVTYPFFRRNLQTCILLDEFGATVNIFHPLIP